MLERLPNTLLADGRLPPRSPSGVGSALGIVAGARPGSRRDRAARRSARSPSMRCPASGSASCSSSSSPSICAGCRSAASRRSPPARPASPARSTSREHMILPVASLGFVYLALYLRLMRDGMAEVWQQDFVRGAVARGIPRRRLVAAARRAQRAASGRHHARPAIRRRCSAAASWWRACLPFPGSGGSPRKRSRGATCRCCSASC